jgi:hypothetical protein
MKRKQKAQAPLLRMKDSSRLHGDFFQRLVFGQLVRQVYRSGPQNPPVSLTAFNLIELVFRFSDLLCVLPRIVSLQSLRTYIPLSCLPSCAPSPHNLSSTYLTSLGRLVSSCVL